MGAGNRKLKVTGDGSASGEIQIYGNATYKATIKADSALADDGQIILGPYDWRWGTAAPGAGSWDQGDIVWNSDPDATEYIGWVCVEAGSPGTWKGFGAIEA